MRTEKRDQAINGHIISNFTHTKLCLNKNSKVRCVFQLNIVAVSMFVENGFERKYLALAV